eukprot:TRINITY_DN4843_c0_g1_i1.p1 TRINITY_DN4843_c0_g1~~TRINITY_DN4843_c0_g1_i1.p1  ORF type:complete len:606 (-),score=109.70 TRINITY_DN4843_c0_g1_i1:46-1863(-)
MSSFFKTPIKYGFVQHVYQLNGDEGERHSVLPYAYVPEGCMFEGEESINKIFSCLGLNVPPNTARCFNFDDMKADDFLNKFESKIIGVIRALSDLCWREGGYLFLQKPSLPSKMSSLVIDHAASRIVVGLYFLESFTSLPQHWLSDIDKNSVLSHQLAKLPHAASIRHSAAEQDLLPHPKVKAIFCTEKFGEDLLNALNAVTLAVGGDLNSDFAIMLQSARKFINEEQLPLLDEHKDHKKSLQVHDFQKMTSDKVAQWIIEEKSQDQSPEEIAQVIPGVRAHSMSHSPLSHGVVQDDRVPYGFQSYLRSLYFHAERQKRKTHCLLGGSSVLTLLTTIFAVLTSTVPGISPLLAQVLNVSLPALTGLCFGIYSSQMPFQKWTLLDSAIRHLESHLFQCRFKAGQYNIEDTATARERLRENWKAVEKKFSETVLTSPNDWKPKLLIHQKALAFCMNDQELSGNSYHLERVQPFIEHYEKVCGFEERIRDWFRAVILVCTCACGVLGVLYLGQFAPISVAIGGMFGSYLGQYQVETRVKSVADAIRELNHVVGLWKDSVRSKTKHVERCEAKLVESCEAILVQEITTWIAALDENPTSRPRAEAIEQG